MKQKLLCFFMLGILLVGSAYAQDRRISGRVTSAADGAPLAGVSVLVVGTAVATQTDELGLFTIDVPASASELEFRYLGFASQRLALGSSSNLQVALSEDVASLSEVVVTAYGTQTRESIAGSVSTLGSEDIAQTQTGNVVQSLNGKVGGVQVRSTNGQPGSAPNVRFRGIGSISSSNAPLYVVDGVPYNGDVAAIAPNDIDQITFLKDAASNALYGSRGANGVIIITTKKGKGDLKINYESRVGYNSRAVKDYDIIRDPKEYYEVRWQRLRLGAINNGASLEEAGLAASNGLVSDLGYNIFNVANNAIIDPATGKLNPSAQLLYHDDWYDALFENRVRHEHSLSLQQGTDKLSTMLSGSYVKDNGYVVNSGFDRISARLALDYNPFNVVKLGANINFASTESNNTQSGKASGTFSNLFSWTRNAAPIYPIYARNSDGSFILDASGDRMYDWGKGETINPDGTPSSRVYITDMNPYATTMEDVQSDRNKNIGFRGYASFDFLQHFNFTYNLGYDYRDSYRLRGATHIGGDASSVGGRLTNAAWFTGTLTNQQLLTYKQQLGQHTVDVMVGHESSDMISRMLAGSKQQLVIPGSEFLTNYSKFSALNGYNDLYKVEGYLSRLNYNYADKYFINASYRRDGSSVFHPDNRWGNFYGIGGAWLISKESFLQDNNAISSLKLKISYGEQGNDNLFYPGYVSMDHRSHFGFARNYLPYMTQYEVTPDANGDPSIREVYLGNEDLKWEVSKNFNTGFEVTLYNRLNIDVEYFQRAVSDMLYNFPLAPSSGTPSISRNIGNMRNRGVEISVDGDAIRTADMNLNIWANATRYKNKVTKLPDPFVTSVFRFVEGQSAYTYYTRKFAGVNPETGAGQWYVGEKDEITGLPTGEMDVTETHSSGTSFLIEGKSANPDWYGGFGLNFRYKGLTVSAGFAYQIGGYIYDNVYSAMFREGTGFGNSGANFHKDIYKTWTPENTSAGLPIVSSVDNTQYGGSDLFLISASYLSFENFSVGYDLRGGFLDRAQIKNARVSVFGNNLGLISKRQGLDPRMTQLGGDVNNGLTLNDYSLLRSLSLGLTLNF